MSNIAWDQMISAEQKAAAAVPPSITPYQARKILTIVGLRSTVEQAVQEADQEVKDAWEYALKIERHSPLVTSIGAALGLTDQQIDHLFIAAAQL